MVVMPDADPKLMADGVLGLGLRRGRPALPGRLGRACSSARRRSRTPRATGSSTPRAAEDRRRRRPGHRRLPGRVVARASGSRARSTTRSRPRARDSSLDGRTGGGAGGAELAPTILDDVDPEGRAAREELFGPLLSLVRVPDLDAAIEWTNGARYGNAAVIFTSSGGAAREFRFGVGAGMLGVNVGVAAPGRVVPVRRLERLDRRRPARQRPRRDRVLHAQEGRHERWS